GAAPRGPPCPRPRAVPAGGRSPTACRSRRTRRTPARGGPDGSPPSVLLPATADDPAEEPADPRPRVVRAPDDEGAERPPRAEQFRQDIRRAQLPRCQRAGAGTDDARAALLEECHREAERARSEERRVGKECRYRW